MLVPRERCLTARIINFCLSFKAADQPTKYDEGHKGFEGFLKRLFGSTSFWVTNRNPSIAFHW